MIEVLVLIVLTIIFAFAIEGVERTGSFLLNSMVAVWEHAYHRITGRTFRLNWLWRDPRLPKEEQLLLFEYMPFYRYLTDAERQNFHYRLKRFRKYRRFTGRQGLEVSPKMELLISAAAVKLTFGMRSFMLREFDHIIIYPEAYKNRQSGAMHKGEVNPHGTVVISWADFYAGVKITDDGLNLGLHEFAHALALQRLNNPRFMDSFFKDHFDKLMRHIYNPGLRKLMQQRSGLRSYALTNPMEFFAVATEVFFEKPADLYRNNKVVYHLFADMYNLETLRIYNRSIAKLNASAIAG